MVQMLKYILRRIYIQYIVGCEVWRHPTTVTRNLRHSYYRSVPISDPLETVDQCRDSADRGVMVSLGLPETVPGCRLDETSAHHYTVGVKAHATMTAEIVLFCCCARGRGRASCIKGDGGRGCCGPVVMLAVSSRRAGWGVSGAHRGRCGMYGVIINTVNTVRRWQQPFIPPVIGTW